MHFESSSLIGEFAAMLLVVVVVWGAFSHRRNLSLRVSSIGWVAILAFALVLGVIAMGRHRALLSCAEHTGVVHSVTREGKYHVLHIGHHRFYVHGAISTGGFTRLDELDVGREYAYCHGRFTIWRIRSL